MQHSTPIDSKILRNVAIFNSMDDEQLVQIGALLKERRYRRGAIIFHQGDEGGCLYIIRTGKVRIYLSSPDGREAAMRVYSEDMAFGEFSVLDGQPRSASAAAITNVTVFALYRADFLHLLEHNFTLVEYVIAMLTERLRYTTNYFEKLAFLSVPGRVAALLLQLASIETIPDDETRLEITQQEIATFVNTTREWVNRALREFEEQTLIRLERGAVIVVDRSGLHQRVN
ncbi:MAG: Crp/Fnr family transcriptional regulator [Chloroflexota bacterium]